MVSIAPTITIVRAIGTLFARRKLRPVLLIAAGVGLILNIIGIWLTTMNEWWWLLEMVCIFLTLLGVIVSVVIFVMLRLVEPKQTPEQRQAISLFVGKMEGVAENLQTPMPLIVALVVRDTIWPHKTGNFIEDTVNNSKTLIPDFTRLLTLFNKQP